MRRYVIGALTVPSFRTSESRVENVRVSGSGERKRPARKLHAPKRKDTGTDRMLTWEEAWPAIPSPRDKNGKWRREVNKLAKSIGWQESALWRYFDDLSCMAEFELGVSRTVSEDVGYRWLRLCFDKTEVDAEVM